MAEHYSVLLRKDDGREKIWNFKINEWVDVAYNRSTITSDRDRAEYIAKMGSPPNGSTILQTPLICFPLNEEKEMPLPSPESMKEIQEHFEKTQQKPSVLQKQEGGIHYKGMIIESAEYIAKNKIGFLPGNAIKYLSRYGSKNGAEDIKKAIHYCEMILEFEYGIKREVEND